MQLEKKNVFKKKTGEQRRQLWRQWCGDKKCASLLSLSTKCDDVESADCRRKEGRRPPPNVEGALEDAVRALRVDPVNICFSDTSQRLIYTTGCPWRCVASTRIGAGCRKSSERKMSSSSRVVDVVQKGEANGRMSRDGQSGGLSRGGCSGTSIHWRSFLPDNPCRWVQGGHRCCSHGQADRGRRKTGRD